MRSKRYDDETAAKKQSFRYTMVAACCALAVLVGAVYTVRANPQWVARWDGRTLDINESGDTGNTVNKVDEIRTENVSKPVPTVDSKDNKSGSAEKPGVQAAPKAAMIQPVEGKISKKFSPDAPVYSQTLDQYVVHDGIDIEAALDTQVKAAAEGTVTKVYQDDKMGLTIEITHADRTITRYSNLSTDSMVGEGDVVKQGAVISGVGDSALFENVDPTHLHFEVIKDGSPVDPESMLK